MKSAIIAIAVICLVGLGLSISASAESANEIPSWIRSNALWWSENQIDDETFVSGIKYLIKEDILIIPQTTQGTISSGEIPLWIKNNAKWWAEDSIDDDSFVQGIQYLISNGILRVTEDNSNEIDNNILNNLGLPYDISDLDLSHGTSHPFGVYRFQWEMMPHPGIDLQPFSGATILAMSDGRIAHISDDQRFEGYAEITVQAGDTSWAVLYESIIPEKNLKVGNFVKKGDGIGVFNGGYALNPALLHIQLTNYPGEFSGYKGESVCWIDNLEDTQRVKLQTAWDAVKDTEEFLSSWENNQADGTYFLKGLGQMYDGAKMCYDDVDVRQLSQSCSGTARCISGTVTKVVDGDTIHVDSQSVRFALASAPELGSYGSGVKETEFIEKICPVGSKVLVDEDDNQTQGSYGRIIGVVYCNGMNLNSELLDSDLGYMDFKLCDISEFSDMDWAVRHGCD